MGNATFDVLGIPIGRITLAEAISSLNGWVDSGTPGHVVNFANVHMMVEAQTDPVLRDALLQADLNCPDGRPLSWVARFSRGTRVSQVAGPDFMERFCEQSAALEHRHFIFGGAQGVAEQAAAALMAKFPGIQIVGTYSPPFRQLSEEEQAQTCERINASGAQLVWVCLGCPKQEKWMFEHRHQLKAEALLGVGQAIDILAGTKSRAPEFMRRSGLEWAYRLACEPRRLFRRYLVTNFLFILWTGRDTILHLRSRTSRAG